MAAARYQLCASDGSACQPVQELTSTDVCRVDGISVPHAGEWVLRLWLVDSAGNVDPANSSAVTLRYGAAPSSPAPQNEPAPSDVVDSSPSPSPLVDVTTTLTTPAPTASTFRRDIGLRLTSARLSHGRLVVRGRIASPTRLTLSIRTRSGRLFRKRISITQRRFTVSLKLRDPRGRVTARFPGDDTFRPAIASLRTTR